MAQACRYRQWDQTKPLGLAQEPPFTPEYQAIFEASLADIKAGGQGNDAPSRCVPFAMLRVMTVVFDMEIVITPGTTYMLFAHSMPRRILTDGSDWPKEIEPTFLGYSIGKWVDADHDGSYDVLEIETRGLKGPRTYESTGMPFHTATTPTLLQLQMNFRLKEFARPTRICANSRVIPISRNIIWLGFRWRRFCARPCW
jgi:hypothetical protein